MKRIGKRYLPILLAILFIFNLSVFAEKGQSIKKKPLAIWDIAKWESIRSAIVSNNGKWFGYVLSPNEGDSKVILRNTADTTEYKFEAGKKGYGTKILFSFDSKWAAFAISPATKAVKASKKTRKKLYDKLCLVNLTTGKDTTFDKIQNFEFSGENPDWIALKEYSSENSSKSKDKAKGAGLLLYNLNNSKSLFFGSISEFQFDKYGKWLSMVVDAEGKKGNGILLRNMYTGVLQSLDNDMAVFEKLSWTEKGDAFAVLKGKKNEDYKDKLYTLIGFCDFSKKSPVKIVYNPLKDASFPENMTISHNRAPEWTEDLSAIIFGINKTELTDKAEKKREEEKKKAKEAEDKKEGKDKKGSKEMGEKKEDEPKLPDMVIWHWKDKRLQSQQWVEEQRDKKYSYLSIYRVKEKKFFRLADDDIRRVEAAPKGHYALGYDDNAYELMGNLDGRFYRDVYVLDLKTGKRKLVLKKSRWDYSPSPDGTHFIYYKEGNFYTYDMLNSRSYNITKNLPVSFINTEDDHNVKNPPTRFMSWLKNGKGVLLNDNWDIWSVPVHGGHGVNLTLNGRKDSLRYQYRFRIYHKEKGVDFSKPQYFTVYGEWTKKKGIVKIDKGRPGPKRLLWGNASFSRLLKAKNQNVFLYTRETNHDFPDYYVAGNNLQNGKRITNANPQQKEFCWSAGVKLVDFINDRGQKLQGALYLPANYEKGKSYPTIVYMYEKLSQRANNYPMPGIAWGGFNQAFYTSNGYAVLTPDITFKINDPGMSSAGCIVPAVKAAIKTGIVDKDHIGIHGHSWGGYQTAFDITQTPIFKAAVAGAPLTNMISMYSSIYWNSGGGNMAIFESSQGRFYGGFWDNLDAYTRNSPVYHAEKVVTPLIILHNDKDGAVDWNQGIEYFNTLRRLKKPVVLLEYKGENHGLRKMENRKDYMVRMKEFFDHYLKDAPAPEWWEKGVPYLKIKEHLKDRVKLLNPPEKEKKKAEKSEDKKIKET
ncbi:S9 family peptidase [bacterium]|nr:S9 family peptidase [bacterium]